MPLAVGVERKIHNNLIVVGIANRRESYIG